MDKLRWPVRLVVGTVFLLFAFPVSVLLWAVRTGETHPKEMSADVVSFYRDLFKELR